MLEGNHKNITKKSTIKPFKTQIMQTKYGIKTK